MVWNFHRIDGAGPDRHLTAPRAQLGRKLVAPRSATRGGTSQAGSPLDAPAANHEEKGHSESQLHHRAGFGHVRCDTPHRSDGGRLDRKLGDRGAERGQVRDERRSTGINGGCEEERIIRFHVETAETVAGNSKEIGKRGAREYAVQGVLSHGSKADGGEGRQMESDPQEVSVGFDSEPDQSFAGGTVLVCRVQNHVQDAQGNDTGIARGDVRQPDEDVVRRVDSEPAQVF